jgi:hypothetical protein
MKLNKILVPFTILMLAYSIFTVVNHLRKEQGPVEPTKDGTSNQPDQMLSSEKRSLLNESKGLMLTGVSSRTPIAEDYTLIREIPWKLNTVQAIYRAAGAENACALLETGTDVIQPLIECTPGTVGPLGRRCAFSIRLQLGKELGEGLPGVTRGIIEDYLKAHQLTIQPSFYHDEQS